MDTFVVRELRVDYLPGRTLLPDSSSNRPNLKKLGLKTGSSIVLQKVDAVPANTTDRSFKLWIQRLKNPQQASNVRCRIFFYHFSNQQPNCYRAMQF